MNQKQNIELIKKIFKKKYPGLKIRFIKIHGSQYQESGLPDLMILVSGEIINRIYWVEIKRDWKDEPLLLQKYNIKNLRLYGFRTAFIAGDEYKENWQDEPRNLCYF